MTSTTKVLTWILADLLTFSLSRPKWLYLICIKVTRFVEKSTEWLLPDTLCYSRLLKRHTWMVVDLLTFTLSRRKWLYMKCIKVTKSGERTIECWRTGKIEPVCDLRIQMLKCWFEVEVVVGKRARPVYRAIKIYPFIHGHRTSKAPHPVRSAQLTGVPPS
jgi:hypothetical protein